MFISEITSHFRNLNISVEIDPLLLQHTDYNNQENTNRLIPVNLYKLIYAIGTIQSRRFAPSNRQKFLDKADLIEKIYSNTTEFKVKIDETKRICGSETLTTMSEDFGVGISVIIATSLFNINYSTIQRIYGTDKRPDWSCQTTDNRVIIVESKGASSQQTSNAQQQNAIVQKNRRTGDIKIASLTVIKENEISTNRFIDPPISSDDMPPDLKMKILRAGHYSSIFSFLGQSLLSKYYSQMKSRLEQTITNQEQSEKNSIYFKLRDNYSNVPFQNKEFAGTFYKIDETRFLFIGIDKNLLSYEDFLEFNDYEHDSDLVQNDNHYMIFKDGILIIEIQNINEFANIIRLDKIKNYQDNITISDVDSMTEISFLKYLIYLLKKNNFEQIRHSDVNNTKKSVADIEGFFNHKRIIFEIKLSKKKEVHFQKTIEQLMKITDDTIDKIVLITNAKIPEEFIPASNKIVLIGRSQLKEIFMQNNKLTEILDIEEI